MVRLGKALQTLSTIRSSFRLKKQSESGWANWRLLFFKWPSISFDINTCAKFVHESCIRLSDILGVRRCNSKSAKPWCGSAGWVYYRLGVVPQFLLIFIEAKDIKHTPESEFWLCSLLFATLLFIQVKWEESWYQSWSTPRDLANDSDKYSPWWQWTGTHS